MNLPIIRRFELWFILSIFISYTVRTLLWSAWKFEQMISNLRQQGIKVNSILDDLQFYNHTSDYNIPFLGAALFSFAAWYLFHFKIFPKIETETFHWKDVIPLTVAVSVTILAAAALGHVTRLDYKMDPLGQIAGLKILSDFRKLYILSDAATLIAIICVYEAVAQSFYRYYDTLITRFEERKLTYILLTGVTALFVFFTIIWGIIPSLFYSIGMRQFWSLLLFLILVYVLQEYYFRKVYVVMHNPKALLIQSYPLTVYIAGLLLGTCLMWAINARFQHHTPPFIIFAAMALYMASMAIAYIRKNQQKQHQILQTEVSTKSAALSSLRSQINPHFLFNALNSLYALALKENSEQTADGIQKLGDMMRFILHENNHERITLKSEVEYLHNYVEIQRMRLDESQDIEIRVNIQEPELEISIAPMLLNPFIENAFKHGISFKKPSWIYITLTMDANKIYFKVHNSFHKQTGIDPEERMGGIGLENVRKRLALIYPDNHVLDIQKSESDFFVALTLTY
ncbi:histidine kinase [Dyadobacter sp. LHD-138]|uniref:sensor histidine kinase n=1 Tax=Dyadobacter sp. LHD-138 TaxID=3071413 RepID=UPI0027E1FF32|nr:histidine kinase [Dyadobacter sp. LHD-138]MDQ6482285.1 histidine kinase [Dyadobacter sp. LHD-138]